MRLLRRTRRLFHGVLVSRTLTPRRLLNTLLLRLQERLRSSLLLARPEILIVEATNACDSTCRLCPVGEGRRARKAAVLDAGTYRRFVDELAPYARRIHYHNWGDPIFDRDLAGKIRYAHSKGLVTFVATALHRLTPERARELVASGLDELSVSLHAATPETYEAYQPGHSFHRVLRNIALLVETRRRAGRKQPWIGLTFVRTRKNQHEVAELPALARRLGVDACRVTAVALNEQFLWSDLAMQDRGLREEEFLAEARRRAGEWLPDDRLAAFDPALPARPKLRTCDRLWRVGLVNSDGTVPPCCDVFRPENAFGRLAPGSRFHEIWNNQSFRAARRSFRRALPGDPLLVCTHCPGHDALEKGRNPVRF